MVKRYRKVNVKDIFLGLQDQMRSKLTLNRKILTHPVAKGDASELEWNDMLSVYLPKRYQTDKAFVIDCKGRISEQIDIVIFDRHYSPFILRQNGATYIPAESVYVVIEVKSRMTKNNITYAGEKALSVRELHRTAAKIVHAGGKIDKPKKPFEILGGILTIDGDCSKKIESVLKKMPEREFLDFGCSLDNESFWFKGDSEGKKVFEKSRKGEALVFFFLRLLAELQKLGTVPAMDIQAYVDKFQSA